VTLPPAQNVVGPLGVTVAAGGVQGLTVTAALLLLLVLFGSVSVAVTLAFAVAVPVEFAVTLMVCTAVPLTGIVPMVQTMVVVPLHDPCVDVGVPLSVTFAGRTMVAVVLVDGARP